jgi:hypothetical protein
MFTFAESGFMYNTSLKVCDDGIVKPTHILHTVNHHTVGTEHNILQICSICHEMKEQIYSVWPIRSEDRSAASKGHSE